MVIRIALAVAALALLAFALRYAAPHAAVEATASSPLPIETAAGTPFERSRHRHRAEGAGDAIVVYVAGAVRKPCLYQLRNGDRDARAVELAGGFSASADAAAVNLAARANDGDEIDVPVAGEALPSRAAHRRSRHRASALPPGAHVDINHAGADELAAVPGIGHSIAQRIVELRDREGAFTSLDELLDVAGMTQSRLDRARTCLQTA